MKTLQFYLRFLLAAVAGYAVMVLLITLVQEVIFGGVGYYESSLLVLLVAGGGTVLSGTVGGTLATWIAPNHSPISARIMGLLVVVETTYLMSAGILDGPVWFDVMASGTLILGILAGPYVLAQLKGRRPAVSV